MMQQDDFATKLVAWYEEHKRDLPWRHTTDPYKIWLSEVILQQTRVQQGLPYYHNFVENYPKVEDFAAADEQDILRLWQGLGYYSRARNMHKAAQTVANELNGQFPSNYKDLLQLKGVGSYTAAAIASFAYGESVAVLDGNVFRVLSRIFDVEEDIASPKGKKTFEALANELIPTKNAGVYNQAIMEFGALHCKPKKPNCMFCPFQEKCEAFRLGKQAVLPVKLKKTKVRNRYFHYLVWEHDGKLLMKERQEGDVWQGLHDFMLVENAPAFLENEQIFESLIEQQLAAATWKIAAISADFKHILSHQRIFARFFQLQVSTSEEFEALANRFQLKILDSEGVEQVPKPKLVVNYLKDTKF